MDALGLNKLVPVFARMGVPDLKAWMSNAPTPITPKELANFEYFDLSSLPQKFTRPLERRVFVNRPINLDKIQYIGFGMFNFFTNF